MPDNNDRLQRFWNNYLLTVADLLQKDVPLPEAWSFGDDAQMADELGQLVSAGIKTATCSLLWEYEADEEQIPQVGDLSIINDGASRPICIIETTEIQIRSYDEVDAKFAYDEGEGDRSLAYWRDAHWRFFSRACERLDRQPAENMPLVCERFQVIFRPG